MGPELLEISETTVAFQSLKLGVFIDRNSSLRLRM